MKRINESGELVIKGYRFPRHADDLKSRQCESDRGRGSPPKFAFFGGHALTEAAIRERLTALFNTGTLTPLD